MLPLLFNSAEADDDTTVVPVLVGSAVLDEAVLVDSLVEGLIDDLRGSLHPEFGVRAYHVDVVTRTWTGDGVGDGFFTEAVGRLDPQPLIEVWDGRRYELRDCGLDEMGEIRLREVSLTYTWGDLTGEPLLANQERTFRLSGAHGQMVDTNGAPVTRDFQIARPPYVDRIEDMGWIVVLRSVAGPGDSGGGC